MYNNIALLIGHLIGDYLFQNDAMALNKSKPTPLGHAWCFVHCSIYAMCVMACVCAAGWHATWGNSWPLAWLIAYLTHYPIDKSGFGWKWMKFFKMSMFQDVDGSFSGMTGVQINKRQYFIAPVYIAVDNTMHLVLMWVLLSLLGK